MSTGLESPVLVLNRNFQPVRVTTARRAFVLLYGGAARALDARYEAHDFSRWAARPLSGDAEWVGTPSGRIAIPRLLLLLRYSRVPSIVLRLSRANIFLRDEFTCQYCRTVRSARELNLDHVVPKSRGGRATWENLVTACRPCNTRKGGRTPEECAMQLVRTPQKPSWSVVARITAPATAIPEWQPFLGTSTLR